MLISPVDGHTLDEIEREEEDEDESEAAQSDITERDNVCSPEMWLTHIIRKTQYFSQLLEESDDEERERSKSPPNQTPGEVIAVY